MCASQKAESHARQFCVNRLIFAELKKQGFIGKEMFEHGGLKRVLPGECSNGAGLNSGQCHKSAETIAVGGEKSKGLKGNRCGRIGIEGLRHWFSE